MVTPRLRFTICDLVWLTACVALGAAWCVEHWRSQAEVSRGVSIRMRDRESYRREADDLKTRITSLEKSLRDAGVQVPEEPMTFGDMTIGELMDALEKVHETK